MIEAIVEGTVVLISCSLSTGVAAAAVTVVTVAMIAGVPEFAFTGVVAVKGEATVKGAVTVRGAVTVSGAATAPAAVVIKVLAATSIVAAIKGAGVTSIVAAITGLAATSTRGGNYLFDCGFRYGCTFNFIRKGWPRPRLFSHYVF